ncbi:MAG: S41 family peptidase [Desulfobaccales bacterium]
MNSFLYLPSRKHSRAPRRLWFLVVLLLSGLFAWGLTTVPSLTSTTATPGSRDQKDRYQVAAAPITDDQLRVFAEALSVVEQQYVEPKTTKDLVYGAIQGAVGALDPHSSFMTPEEFKDLQVETKGKFSGIGIEITMKNRILTVVSPIEGTPAFRAGIQAGDQIIKVDGVPTKNISLSEAVRKIRGPKGSKVTLTINRQGFTKPRDFSIVREIIPIRSVKARLIEGGYGYIRVSNFQDTTDKDLRNFLTKMVQRPSSLKGLILDLRNDPGGLLDQAVLVADEFLSHGLIVRTEGRDSRQRMQFHARPGNVGDREPFPIVVLINEGSASASEIVAGALKDQNRAVVVGTKSFGKGSVQTIIPLSDGSALRLTTALYYTPSGKTIHEKGIIPDIEVKDQDSAEGKTAEQLRDEALDRHMRGEGITDKPWDKPLTEDDLRHDPVLKKAVDILRQWPPKGLAQKKPGG